LSLATIVPSYRGHAARPYAWAWTLTWFEGTADDMGPTGVSHKRRAHGDAPTLAQAKAKIAAMVAAFGPLVTAQP